MGLGRVTGDLFSVITSTDPLCRSVHPRPCFHLLIHFQRALFSYLAHSGDGGFGFLRDYRVDSSVDGGGYDHKQGGRTDSQRRGMH